MTAEVQPEGPKNDVPNTNLTDGKDELFCGPQKTDTSKDCAQMENSQDGVASQTSMDCGSASGLDESTPVDSGCHSTQSHYSDGQKSKRSTSPGPHPVKTTCVSAHSPNPKLTLPLSSSPMQGVSTPSDVEMLSPNSPICKTMLVNSSAEKLHDGSACAEDSSSAKESQQCVKDSDSECSVKENPNPVSTGTEDAEIAEYSGSSDMSQDLGELSERYLFIFLISESPFLLCPRSAVRTMSFTNCVWYTDLCSFCYSQCVIGISKHGQAMDGDTHR